MDVAKHPTMHRMANLPITTKEFSSTNYQEWRLKNPALYHIASGIGYTLATKNVVCQPAALHHLGPC